MATLSELPRNSSQVQEVQIFASLGLNGSHTMSVSPMNRNTINIYYINIYYINIYEYMFVWDSMGLYCLMIKELNIKVHICI